MNYSWKRIKSNSLPNLNVLTVNDVEVGFITKPRDTRCDKNAWRVFRGIGYDATLLGHAWTPKEAKSMLETNLVK